MAMLDLLMNFYRLFFVVLPAVALSAAALADDWPQWRGPDRTGLSRETGLLKTWPAGGPPRIWTNSSLGAGYGSVAVRGDRIYVQSMIGRQSTVGSLNVADGKLVWSRILGPARDDDRGPGPRGTPTLDGDRLYALS